MVFDPQVTAIDLEGAQGAPFTEVSRDVSKPSLNPLQRLPEDSLEGG
jgi:hypothetical protein